MRTTSTGRLWTVPGAILLTTALVAGCGTGTATLSTPAQASISPSAGAATAPTESQQVSAAPASNAPACTPTGGKVQLTFWNWLPGVDKAVAIWNAEHPDIQVTVNNVPVGNEGTYQNMFNAIKAGTVPDLGQVEYDTLAPLRIAGGLQDISGCPGVADATSSFVPWTWDQAEMGGSGVWGIPQDIGPLALYYRKDIFDKAGLAAPTTWQDYHDDAVKLKAMDSKLRITHVSQTDPNWLVGMLWQNGAHLFSTQGDAWSVTIDSPEARAVTDYWQSMIDQKLVATDLQGFSEALNKAWDTGQVVSWISAPWGWTVIRDGAPSTAGKWAVAPIPQWSAGATSDGNWGGSTTAVFAGSKHPAEAAAFALWLNTDARALGLMNELGGIYPAANAGLQLSALSEGVPFYGGQKIFDVFKTAASQVDTGFVWGPTMTDTYRFLADGIAKALTDGGTLTQALTDTQTKTVESLKTQGISVTP